MLYVHRHSAFCLKEAQTNMQNIVPYQVASARCQKVYEVKI